MSLNKITKFLLILLIIVCVFDPADQIFHMKMPLFIGCWLMVIVSIISSNRQIYLPYNVVNYSLALIIIPLFSIAYYYLLNGDEPYDGFQYFKAYLFSSLIVLLYVSRIDLLKPLCIILTLLSMFIVGIFFASVFSPLIYIILADMGYEYDVLRVGARVYGGVTFNVIFYVTSPMIAISIAAYVYKSMVTTGGKKILNIILSAINVFAMFLAGTRNNIIIAIALPLFVLIWFSKHRIIIINVVIVIAIAIVLTYIDTVRDMFSATDVSNEHKLSYLVDYSNIFSNIGYLFFGQGLGAYNYWSVLGMKTSITELTYLEIFRNYGIILGAMVFTLIVYPLKYLKYNYMKYHHYALIGYIAYLVMCFSNPLFFSSSGMLLLSIIATKCFLTTKIDKRNKGKKILSTFQLLTRSKQEGRIIPGQI